MKENRVQNQVVEVTIKQDSSGQRVDNFLIKTFKGVPKSRIYRAIRQGEVRINKKRAKAEHRLQLADIVRLPPLRHVVAKCSNVTHKKIVDSLLGQRKIYEDDELLVINKPAGLAVHRGTLVPFGVIDILSSHYPELTLGLVHRLDKATSGCLLIAKTRATLLACHEQLRHGSVMKKYVALLDGVVEKDKIEVDAALAKNRFNQGEHLVDVSDDGKASVTLFNVLQRFEDCTLVEAIPKTGRMHQIRVHATLLGHPIIGDHKYTKTRDMAVTHRLACDRLFLHAAEISLYLPHLARAITFKAEWDQHLLAVMAQLEGQS